MYKSLLSEPEHVYPIIRNEKYPGLILRRTYRFSVKDEITKNNRACAATARGRVTSLRNLICHSSDLFHEGMRQIIRARLFHSAGYEKMLVPL